MGRDNQLVKREFSAHKTSVRETSILLEGSKSPQNRGKAAFLGRGLVVCVVAGIVGRSVGYLGS